MEHDNNLQNEIKKIEEGAKKKENYIKDRIDKEHGSKINELESKLKDIRNEFNQINKTLEELEIKQKELKKRKRELIVTAQPLKKDLKNLTEEELIEEDQSKIKITDKGYAILYEDILAEVECALMKGKHKTRSGKSRDGEDVVDIRRYEYEDRFRDISLRRTMREVITKRRHPEKIQREDIRIKERRPLGCMDVVLALDRSSSMIEV